MLACITGCKTSTQSINHIGTMKSPNLPHYHSNALQWLSSKYQSLCARYLPIISTTSQHIAFMLELSTHLSNFEMWLVYNHPPSIILQIIALLSYWTCRHLSGPQIWLESCHAPMIFCKMLTSDGLRSYWLLTPFHWDSMSQSAWYVSSPDTCWLVDLPRVHCLVCRYLSQQ